MASVWALPAGIGTEPWHDHFKTLVCVHRQTDRFDTRMQDWHTSNETAYYLCDMSLSAEQANHVIRQHWGVENKVHYVRDTQFNEDASRIRCNPGMFAFIRSFALNVFRANHIKNISLALYENALSLDNLLSYSGI